MNDKQVLLQAIHSLWPELPALLAEDWPPFEAQLTAYLEQLEREPGREAILRAQILDLFGRHPPAHRRLIDLMRELRDDGPLVSKGIASPKTPPVLTRLLQATVTRYTDIACPRRVWLETPRISVVVRLTLRPAPHSEASEELALRQDLPVRVRVEAPAFESLNEPEQETPIQPQADSPPLVFDLRPRQAGPTRITFDFLQAGNPLGTASVPVEISAGPVSAAPEEAGPRQPLRLETGAVPPDYMLYISHVRFHTRPALVFTLIRAGQVGRTFHPVPLESDPKVYARHLYQRLTVLTSGLDPAADKVLFQHQVLSPEDVDRRLRQLGQSLWREMVPQELRELYAGERMAWRDRSLLIVSDEPYIPWEVAWPYGREWADDAPWCITTRLARWLRRDAQGNGHEAPPTRLPFGALACLAPTDSELRAAQQEREFLGQLVVQHQLTDLSPASPTWSQVMDLLEAGGYDWLHVAAHGNFYAGAPEAASAIWLQGEYGLTPGEFVGPAIEGHLHRQRPAFVFNACHSGRQGWALTHLGGWTNRLLSSGAGLFLAPLWTVTDSLALTFASALYEGLLAGQTVAEAVRQARLAARKDGDPTWLAYSLYAHPNARLAFEAGG